MGNIMQVNVPDAGAADRGNGEEKNEHDYKAVYEVITETLTAIKAAQEQHNE